MNMYKHTFLLVIGLLISSTSWSAIHRVNINPSTTAGFQDFQTAVNAAFDGDTIYLEANSQFVSEPFFATYTATINKPLVVFGPGYLIADNKPGYNVVDEALCSNINLGTGAVGIVLRGLSINDLQVNSDFAQIDHNFISHLELNGALGYNIDRNLISSPNSMDIPLLLNNSNNGNVSNNIIAHESAQAPGQYVVFQNSSSGIDFNHNVIANGFINAEASLFHNCIFIDLTFEDFDFCNFNNDIFVTGVPAATDFDAEGNTNDQMQILLGSNVQTEIDPGLLFAGNVSLDGQFETFPGSFADGVADDGTNIGPFNQGGYGLSGQSDFPFVTNLFIAENTEFSYLLPVTFAAVIDSGTDIIVEGEYFVDSDPGFGGGVQVTVTPGNIVEGFFGANIATTLTGAHVIGFRVRTQSGLWSGTEETTFVVDPIPTLPSLASISYVISDVAGSADFATANILDNQDGSSDLGFFTIVYDLSGYAPGLYYLSVRAKDEFGVEGTTYVTPMLVLEDQADLPTLTAFEYFIDVDPGYGEGNPILLSGADDLFESEVQFELTGVTPGQHTIFLRAKDSNGAYGVTQQQDIYVVSDQFSILDQNSDCVIDILDLLAFLGDYGCIDDGTNNCSADVNGDGATDILDILTFLMFFGSDCQGTFGLVPGQESSTFVE
jgi:hypothetical protein